MSRVKYRRRMTETQLSRRRVITIAAAAGVGVSVAGVTGLSLAGTNDSSTADGNSTESSVSSAPLVISLRDAKKGTFDVFSGGSKSTLTDKALAARLLKAVHR
jgi:hypothetical protein